MKLKPMYTAGFAAPEHYRFKPEELGPWSDIYSVGATMYTCIAGTPPQAGDQREQKDKMIPVRSLARQDYSDDLYDIVESCLRLDWLKRPQTAFDLQKRLAAETPGAGPDREDRSILNTISDTFSKPLSRLFSK
jgi:serine/threonine protein kinase